MTNAYLLVHLNEIDKMAKTLSRYTNNYEDIRQEMCVACLEIETDSPFKYVMKSMMNKAIDYLKSRKHNYSYDNVFPHISLDYWLDLAVFGYDTHQGRRARVVLEYWFEHITYFPWPELDVEIRVDSILNTLDEKDRLLLYNYFGRGETQEDIGEHDGVTRSMVSKRLSDIKKKLRKRYSDHNQIYSRVA